MCGGCLTVQFHSRPAQSRLDRVLSGEAFFGERAERLSLPQEDIFGITREMRDFLKANVPGSLSRYGKLRRLIEAVTDKSRLGWDYDAFKTSSAADTFRNKQGNCLSYAIMMAVLGRELGLEMQFNEVHIPPTWEIQTESTVVLFRHVNVLVKVGYRRMVLDLNIEEYDSSYPQWRITDIEAEAHYYNNRGANFLNADDMEQAFLHFRKALALQPEQGFIWGNMGALYLRYGHYREAEAALLRALELDSSEITAISNLQRLYVQQGDAELSEYYKREAERVRMKNPYYRYYLARKLLDDDQPLPALKQIKRSIRSYKTEHRFHFLAAKIYACLGRSDDAEKSLVRAAELAEDEKNRLLYQSKMARLREISKHGGARP